MEDQPQKLGRMPEEVRRSNYITWGVGLLTLALAWAVEYFGGLHWAAIGILILGCAGVVLLLRGHFPHWFTASFWTEWKRALGWSVLCIALVAAGLYAAALYVTPLPFCIQVSRYG
jgi:hypothetical protein